MLSDRKWIHERSAYTFMTLIGDVGGFNGAMVLLPTYLMSYFSFIMYKWAVTEEMPVKKGENTPPTTGFNKVT